MWKPPDDLRQRWIERDFKLEFVVMTAMAEGRLEKVSLPRHDGRADLRAFDTPPLNYPRKTRVWDRLGGGRKQGDWQTIREIRLDKIDFTHARLSNLIFERVEFEDCVFDRAEVEGVRFGRCDFQGCSFVRTDLTDSNLGHFWTPDRWLPSSFDDCSLANATLTYTQVLGSSFRRCDFSRARMKRCAWIGASLTDCTFAGQIEEAEFRASDWEAHIPARHDMLDNVDLSKTSLRWVEIYGQNLKGTRFPPDADHLVVRNYRCFLEALRDAVTGSEAQGAGFARDLATKGLKNLGPEQDVGVFNLRDWFDSWDEAGQAAMRTAFASAAETCGLSDLQAALRA